MNSKNISISWLTFNGPPLQSFLLLTLLTIVATYLLPDVINSLWYIILLILYFRSKDEPFWLSFFFVLSDGFMGFFGSYEIAITLIPGLPAIEVSQIYILLAVTKAITYRKKSRVFYQKILVKLFIYIILLILIGQMYGVRGGINIHFRVFKIVIPLLLFYAIPRLLRTKNDYQRFFSIVFFVSVAAMLSQIFNVITGMSPAEYMGIIELSRYSEIYLMNSEGYRGFFNPNIVIISFFGALYYLTKKESPFRRNYLFFILGALFFAMILSATRGWIISFGLILTLYFVLLAKIKFRSIIRLVSLLIAIWLLVILQPRISTQLMFSTERISTLEDLVEGDITASNTLRRLDQRGPAVMNKWKEKKIFGWGFSKEFFDHYDGHVGNQNILFHSGLIGASLMMYFILSFCIKILITGKIASKDTNFSGGQFYVFVIFILGWLVLHSTSGQQFSYYQLPSGAITQALFFSFGAWNYLDFKLANSLVLPVKQKNKTRANLL